jgi:hypothetical protein
MNTIDNTQRTISESLKEKILDSPVIFTVSVFALGVITSLFVNDTYPSTEKRLLESLAQSNGPITQQQYTEILLFPPLLESAIFALTLFTVMMTIHHSHRIKAHLQNTKKRASKTLQQIRNNTVKNK